VRTALHEALGRFTFAEKVSLILIAATLISLSLTLTRPFLFFYLYTVCGIVLIGVFFLMVRRAAGPDRWTVPFLFVPIFLLAVGYAGLQTLPPHVPFEKMVRVRMRLHSYPSVRRRGLQFRAVLLEIEAQDHAPKQDGVSNSVGSDRRVPSKKREFHPLFGRTFRVLFSTPLPREPVHRGDVVETEGMFFPLPVERSPEYAAYLRSIGMKAVFEASPRGMQVVRRAHSGAPLSVALRLRGYIEEVYKRLMPSPHDIFATALLTGNREPLPDDITELFRRSGTMHILAVSGLHVGFLSLFLLFLLRLIRVPKYHAYLLLCVFIVFFMLFVGERPSVRRASLMALCGIACLLFDRDRDYINVLALVFIILWVLNPLSLLDPGFLLSFCATFGILFVMPLLFHLLSRSMPKFIAGSIAVTLSVQLFMFPILSSYFGSFAYINVLANLPIVPLTGISLALGVLTLMMYPLFLPLAVIVAEVNTVVISSIARLARFFALVPPLRLDGFPKQLIPLYLAGITIGLWLIRRRVEAGLADRSTRIRKRTETTHTWV
jgi:ComEC/Rec2-related protein